MDEKRAKGGVWEEQEKEVDAETKWKKKKEQYEIN